MRKILIFMVLIFGECFSYDYELSVCTIFKNDVEYLPEWIEFHLDHGVEHFFLYDNHAEPIDLSNLNKYVKKGVVEIIPWRHQHGNNPHAWCHIQCSSYMDCVKKNKDSCKWIAFIDTDEFLFSPKQKDLRVVLKDYEQFAGVCVNWVMYGTSGISHIPKDQKMLNLLVYRAPLEDLHIKSIVQPQYVEKCCNMHFFIMMEGKYSVTENKEFIYGAFSKYNSVKNLRINHYWSRDIEFFENRKISRIVGIDQAEKLARSIESSLNKEYDPILADTSR